MNMIMCGNDIFANVYMRLYWVRALNTRTSTLIRKKRFGQSQICRTKTTILRQKQTWSDVSENQGTRITSYQKLSSVQLLSRVQLFATPWIAARQASLSITNSRSLLKLMPIELVMPSSHLILCCTLLLLSPITPSTRAFSNESTLLMRWPKYWSFSFSISPSSEHPGLISFRMHWLDLLAVQGTLKSLLQHHSSKASIFWRSVFFTVQLSPEARR